MIVLLPGVLVGLGVALGRIASGVRLWRGP
jgi:hypothetical protein